MHNPRLINLRSLMTTTNLDAFLVTDINNIFYLSGFTGSTAALIVTATECHILVDPRYTTQAKGECKSAQVHEYIAKPTITASAEFINELHLHNVGFESDNLTVSLHKTLRELADESINLDSTSGVIEKLRRIKDQSEIELIKKAANIVDATFDSVVKQIHIGMTEKEVALLIDTTMRKLGADKEGFDTISAAGPNSACPHASPTDRILEQGQFLKIDYGATYKRYNSDITRTVCLGDPSTKQKEIYQVVLDAQMRAIEAIAPGKSGKEIDAVAREYITSMGYGNNFGHGLGHALGIEVHDGPAFSKMSNIILEPGMVATVEPGIYIEDWGGVRIEDDIIVTETGFEIITYATKELIIID